MTSFTDWDILRNLLLAARWTILLSLVAFFGGTLVTLPLLFLRLLKRPWLTRLIRCYTELFQGTPLLMQLFLAFFGVGLFGIDVAPWTAASLALTFYTSAFWWISGTAAFVLCRKASGSVALSRSDFRSNAVSRGGTPGDSHRHRANRGLCRAGNQRHRAGLDYRFCRTDQSRHHFE